MSAQKSKSKPFLLTACFLLLSIYLPAVSTAADAALNRHRPVFNHTGLTLSLSAGEISSFNIGIKHIKNNASQSPYEKITLNQSALPTPERPSTPELTQQKSWLQKWQLTAVLKEWVSSLQSNYGLILNSSTEKAAYANHPFGPDADIAPKQQRKFELIYSMKIN